MLINHSYRNKFIQSFFLLRFVFTALFTDSHIIFTFTFRRNMSGAFTTNFYFRHLVWKTSRQKFLANVWGGEQVALLQKKFDPLKMDVHPRCIQVSQEECARLREGVPYVKVYRYNPKHLCPKLNGYGDNGQRSLKL